VGKDGPGSMIPDGPGWFPGPWERALERGYNDGMEGRPPADVAPTSRGNSYLRGYREGLREAIRRGQRWPYYEQAVAQQARLVPEPEKRPVRPSRPPRPAKPRPEGRFRCVDCKRSLPLADRSLAFPSSCKGCVDQREKSIHRDNAELLDRLTALVQARPGLTTGDLVALLPDSGATKGEINVLLHRHSERFASIHQPPDWVRWYARGGHRPTRVKIRSKRRKSSTSSQRGLDLYPWQREALATWRKHGHRGLIAAVTGTGKTHIGLEAAREELDRHGRVLVLVPTRELQDQWYERLRSTIRGYRIGRLGGGRDRSLWDDDIVVATVQSACRRALLPPDQHGLLIADECHRYGAETYQRALDPRFAYRLGLTATPERSDDAHLVYLEPYFGGPPIFRMDYRRAIAEGVVTRFKLALVGVRFTEHEQQSYDELIETLQDARELLLQAGVPQEPFGIFMKVVGEIADDPRDPACRIARRYLQAFSRRREVLANARRKTVVVGELARAVERATGTLLFTMTTDHAEHLARVLVHKGVKAEALHSGLSMGDRRSLLRNFGARQLKALAAPMVLDEGVDVPEADLAIIVAASQTERQMIQRMGRVLRKKADGRLARIAIVYVSQTLEDPARGAHEVFLDTVRTVADKCQDFRPGTSIKPIVTYLNDF
jgi:superfamily II DNA or RNA helicase